LAAELYGAGLRLMECPRLRVKDIDFDRKVISCGRAKARRIASSCFLSRCGLLCRRRSHTRVQSGCRIAPISYRVFGFQTHCPENFHAPRRAGLGTGSSRRPTCPSARAPKFAADIISMSGPSVGDRARRNVCRNSEESHRPHAAALDRDASARLRGRYSSRARVARA